MSSILDSADDYYHDYCVGLVVVAVARNKHRIGWKKPHSSSLSYFFLMRRDDVCRQPAGEQREQNKGERVRETKRETL